jgi:glycosyltransferase involved in cell wall biosynthesis
MGFGRTVPVTEDESFRVLLVDTARPDQRGSMSRYADLVRLALKSSKHRKKLIVIEHARCSVPPVYMSLLPGIIGTWLNHFWLMLVCRQQLGRNQPDLIHILDGSFGYLVPRGGRSAVVATVHDLIPALRQSGRFGDWPSSYAAKLLISASLNGLQRCDQLLAVSASTAIDLASLTGLKNEKIAVSPLALADEFLDETEMEHDQTCEKKNRFIFHVGNNARYKNREGVIRIFQKLRQKFPLKLRMAGPPPTSEMQNLLRDNSLDGDVEFIVGADDSKLRELYGQASVFLFPSLYEGFGWPPLEAMACGCPVVCSNEGSLPEVVGDAALTASASDESRLVRHCLAVLTDNELATKLSAKGRLRARTFSLDRMRRDLLDAYRKALEHHARSG